MKYFGIALHAMGLSLAFLAIFWSSAVSLSNREAEREIHRLERQIYQAEQERSVAQAEWIYLNRPERLRRLVAQQNDRLGLITLAPGHFSDARDHAALDAPKSAPEIDEFLLANGPGAVLPYMIDPRMELAGGGVQ